MYAACHDANGRPTVLTVWVPLVPVSCSNGCMFVVPADRDPLFARSEDPQHMQPDKAMPWPYAPEAVQLQYKKSRP